MLVAIDTLDAIERCAARALRSGSVFDALHLITAEQARADILLTFDHDDFLRLAETDCAASHLMSA